MIVEIGEQLDKWGEWQRLNTGIGGVGVTTHYGPPGGHGLGQFIIRDPQSERLDLIICELGQRRGWKYQHVLVAKYCWQYTDRMAAELLHWSVPTVKIRVNECHAWLDGRMQEELKIVGERA